MIILYIILILFGCILLGRGADLTVKNLTKIAAILRWNQFVISFILVAIATSLPEVFVGIISALNKTPSLSLGNIIGANIINLTFILGLIAILSHGLDFKTKTTQKHIILSLSLSILPMLLALDGFISRLDGLIVLIGFAFYIFIIFSERMALDQKFDHFSKQQFYKYIIYLAIGLVLLIGSAELVTKMAKILATGFNFPPIFTGLLIVSLGTTLPELAFGLKATLKGYKEMPLGCSLGTIVTNSCLALGLASLIYPIKIIYFNNFLIMFGFLILANLIFAIFAHSKKQLSLEEGVVLVIFYIIFVIIQFFFKK